jgi:peptidoglycan/LPS O-acetylase OafA/YrhL
VKGAMKERIFVLDGARGIAAFCILLFHLAAPTLKVFENLYIAVDFFFVLSGFVLANSIISIRTHENLKRFVVARYFRIAPMLISVLSFYLTYDAFFITRNSILNLGEPAFFHNILANLLSTSATSSRPCMESLCGMDH